MAKVEINNQKMKQIVFEKDISIKELSQQSQVSQAEIYNILNGEQGAIFERTAFRLAKTLHCNLSDLIIHLTPSNQIRQIRQIRKLS